MKKRKIGDKLSNRLKIKRENKSGRQVGSPRRWRVEIINENTLTRMWSIELSGARIWLASGLVLGAVASLIIVLLLLTPLGSVLPGHLGRDMRGHYVDAAMRLDSLEEMVSTQLAYAHNVIDVLRGEGRTGLPPDTAGRPAEIADSLLQATEAERRFVRQFESRERYNLSVLAPIAAEGMIFESPTEGAGGYVDAIYRGTVLWVERSPGATFTVSVQHPNNFVSIYSGLEEIYVSRGSKLIAGQRIGRAAPRGLVFGLWHDGSELNPADYVDYQASN